MPYCPDCRYEYREGVEKCPDCDQKLVDALRDEPEPESKDPNLVCVASYPFEIGAQQAKLRLQSHGIQSVLVNEVLSKTDVIMVFADGGVRVMVRKEDLDKAREALESE